MVAPSVTKTLAPPTKSELVALLPYLTPHERAEIDRLLGPPKIWEPLPGPQTRAYLSEADETLYGGAAGGGKTDLLLGLAATQHWRSIIFRREFPQLRGLIERSVELFDAHGKLNKTEMVWRLSDGRYLEFGACQYEEDVKRYQGRPHDLKAFDELTNFTEKQYRFLIGWNRTTRQGQRIRTVSSSNPPMSTDGEWILRYWAPWLEQQHPRPALPGELRWYAVIEGKDVEVENGAPLLVKGKRVQPRSRTFIPARLVDNPYLLETGYEAVLQGMPEPLRSQLLFGDFAAGVEDHPWQVIPTAWVKAAQARWKPEGAKDRRQETVGVDVARGGKAKTVLARRFGPWFAPLEKHPGSATPDGPAVARLVVSALRAGGVAKIDVIGVGASVFDQCRMLDLDVEGVNFAESIDRKDRTGKLRFVNVRAFAYWSLREALDPERGDGLSLPPDPELLADLCSPRWSMRLNGVQIESKEDIHQRIGRSPDSGDALVLSAVTVRALPYSGEGWDSDDEDDHDD